MLRTVIAGLRGHLRRLVATTLAVVFAVAFVAGTLIFDDTARAAYAEAFTRVLNNVDVVVQSGSAPLTTADLERVRELPDVTEAEGRMVQQLALLDPRGRPVTNFGFVGVAVSTDATPSLRPFDIVGESPDVGEALLDTDTAERLGYHSGDTITVVDVNGTRHRYPLTGLIDYGLSRQYSGQSVVGLPASVIASLTGAHEYEELVVHGRDGVGAAELAGTVAKALGDGPRVVTAQERAEELTEAAAGWTDAFRILLLLFGAVSLVVAAFVISNTFAVLSALRVRQTALLRCLGATRGQLFGATLLESAIIGLAGGALGVLLGAGIARGLVVLMNSAFDMGVPAGPPVLGWAPFVVGGVLGVVVTVASAFVPAIQATRTSPLAVLRDQSAVVPARRRAARLVVAGLCAALGLGVTVAGYDDPDPQTGAVLVVLGGTIVFLGLLIALPTFIGPLTTVVGSGPARLLGTPARLAIANARRNPGRTAVTAGALTIGVGLMSAFTVVMSSVSVTASRQLAEQYPVDFVVTGVRYGGGEATLPPGYAPAVRARPEFAAVAQIRVVTATVDGAEVRIGAVDHAGLGALVTPPLTSGSLADLRPGTAIVSRTLADTSLGESLTVSSKRASGSLTVVGSAPTLAPGPGYLDLLVTWSDLAALAGEVDDVAVLIKMAPGVSPAVARTALDALTDTYPLVSVGSVADLNSDNQALVDGLLALVGGLLVITVLISIFGVANTLSLSVVERTRESATVRALGLTRAQLRSTLLVEALLLALVSTIVGLGFGLAYGTVLARTVLATLNPAVVLPWTWFAGIALLMTVTALIAAVLPARAATRASIVAAMADVG